MIELGTRERWWLIRRSLSYDFTEDCSEDEENKENKGSGENVQSDEYDTDKLDMGVVEVMLETMAAREMMIRTKLTSN